MSAIEQIELESRTDDLDLSVVLPCLNEARGVSGVVRKGLEAIDQAGLEGEVVVVDNGSSDGSPAAAVAAGARVVEEPVRGYGAACRRGLDEARGRVIVLADADGSYDTGDLVRFYERLDDAGVDLVMGTRLEGEIHPGAMPWSHRYIGSPILTAMLRILFGGQVSDAHCGMRAIRRNALDRLDLRTTGMEFASEMIVAALRSNLVIDEIPISYHPRVGVSKLDRFRDAWRHVRYMLTATTATD